MKSWNNTYLLSLAAYIVLLIGLYVFGIRRTLDAYRSYFSLSLVKQDPTSIMAENQILESRFEQLSGTITDMDQGAISLSYLNLMSHDAGNENLVLRHFENPTRFQTELFSIYESRFILNGSFINTLEFIQKMETSRKHGDIISLTFYVDPGHNNQLNIKLICRTLSNK